MRIAIVGSGISGLGTAYLLHRSHEITVFEAKNRVGGHTDTHIVDLNGSQWHVDSGFIVYNEQNYPNFTRLLDRLDVATQTSSMSFCVRCDPPGVEYNGTSLNQLFAQRRNMFRPTFHRMLLDMFRFNREAPQHLANGAGQLTLQAFLAKRGYSRAFVDQYLIPMGADDRPYEIVATGVPTGLVELPVHWILDDAQLPNPLGIRYSTPREVLQGYRDESDRAYEEGTIAFGECILIISATNRGWSFWRS